MQYALYKQENDDPAQEISIVDATLDQLTIHLLRFVIWRLANDWIEIYYETKKEYLEAHYFERNGQKVRYFIAERK